MVDLNNMILSPGTASRIGPLGALRDSIGDPLSFTSLNLKEKVLFF